MSTPKKPRRGPVRLVETSDGGLTLTDLPYQFWTPLEAVPGYLISTDGRIAREIKVRTNKNGTRWARVSIKGRQHVIRV